MVRKRSGLRLLPFVQIDAASSGFAGDVDREERLDAFPFAANREGTEEFVPAFWRFLQVRSLGSSLEPFVQFYRHGSEELPLFHPLQQVFAEGSAADVSWRLDLDSRHDLADGVDYLFGDAFGFFGARLGLFEACVKLSQGFPLGSLRLAAASGRCRVSSTTLSLFRGCHIGMLAETDKR